MEITEIIKESFIFPSTDLAKLAIYIVLLVVTGLLVGVGSVFIILGAKQGAFYLALGIILFIIGLIIGLIVTGYQISIIKSGIKKEEKVPIFKWGENLLTGIKYLVVNIVYFIIPAIITLIVGWITGVYEKSWYLFTQMMTASMNAPANTTVVITDIVPQSYLVSLGNAMILTGIIAAVLFILFAIIETMGGCRLANTDNLGEALNIPEAFKDIGRIGWGKVIAVIIAIALVNIIINLILSGLNNYVSGISILSIVITPYLVFFSARATGLLYSDIA